MIVGIIGSGGREHSICYKIKSSKKINKIYCFPGNAGTSEIAENIDIGDEDFKKIKDFCLKKGIDLLIVGPEKPLVKGIVDYFSDTNINVFGPNKVASQLEGSKIFTKKLCEENHIPTAKFKILTKLEETKIFIKNSKFPLVIKADGLASGKGVYICKKVSEAIKASEEIFGGKFGIADSILIEEFLEGEEMSYFIVSDGNEFKFFGTAQDHKRVGEGDIGKNTGGMGCYSPSRLFNSELDKKIISKIIKPTLNAINKIGSNYLGFLYVGLMIKNNEPYLVEFNVRMGDPECQTLLPLLNTDLLEIIMSCCLKKLKNQKIEFIKKKSICVVLCSNGYPDKYVKNIKIDNLINIVTKKNENIFHAGTKKENGDIYAIGGRVLNFVSTSDNLKETRNKIFNLIKKLNWKDGFYRKDIGYKVID